MVGGNKIITDNFIISSGYTGMRSLQTNKDNDSVERMIKN